MEGGVDVVVAIHQQQVIALLLDAEIESRSARDPIPFCRIEIFDSIATRGDAEMIGIGAADQRVPAATICCPGLQVEQPDLIELIVQQHLLRKPSGLKETVSFCLPP